MAIQLKNLVENVDKKLVKKALADAGIKSVKYRNTKQRLFRGEIGKLRDISYYEQEGYSWVGRKKDTLEFNYMTDDDANKARDKVSKELKKFSIEHTTDIATIRF